MRSPPVRWPGNLGNGDQKDGGEQYRPSESTASPTETPHTLSGEPFCSTVNTTAAWSLAGTGLCAPSTATTGVQTARSLNTTCGSTGLRLAAASVNGWTCRCTRPARREFFGDDFELLLEVEAPMPGVQSACVLLGRPGPEAEAWSIAFGLRLVYGARRASEPGARGRFGVNLKPPPLLVQNRGLNQKGGGYLVHAFWAVFCPGGGGGQSFGLRLVYGAF